MKVVCWVADPVNLVQNGGFETGSFSGWTYTGLSTEGVTAYSSWPQLQGLLPPRGTYAAAIGTSSPAYLSQAIFLPPKICNLSFYVARPQVNTHGYPGDVAWLTASIDSQVVVNASWVQGSWQLASSFFQGQASVQTLQFTIINGPDTWWLDDVSIQCFGDDAPVAPGHNYGMPSLTPLGSEVFS